KSGSSREAILAAKNLGYYTILFTDQEKQIAQKEEYPEIDLISGCNFDDINTINKLIDYFCKWYEIKAIVSFIDPYCALAAKISSERKLNNFSYQAMEKMQNKLQCREVLK